MHIPAETTSTERERKALRPPNYTFSMEKGVRSFMPKDRIKVHIRCRLCGESYILRGTRNVKGHIDTGFKRCLCDNERDFEIETLN
jgi:formylmethanofuran dehydrogenase subunit E